MINQKILVSLFLSLAVAISFSNCSDSTNKSTKKEAVEIKKENVLKAVINVKGMTCEGCESSIQTAVSKMSGVVNVKASHVDENTVIEYDKTQTSAQEIEKVISSIGYKIFQDAEKEEMKEAPKAAMKCGEGKCGTSMSANSE